MLNVRRSAELRHTGKENQTTWMTFDRENKADRLGDGFGSLKMLNEEILPHGRTIMLHTHTHKAMVIVTYVEEGVIIYHGPLERSDMLEEGDFHRINVSPEDHEYNFNAILSGYTHVFQSGFTSDFNSMEPGGRKKLFTHADRHGILKLIASPDGRAASLPIQQDVFMYSAVIRAGQHLVHKLNPGRNAWLHVVKGGILANGLHLQTGDGAGFSDESSVSIAAQQATEILLFDLAKSEVKTEALTSPASSRG
jgi:redox-sensitive bicupin YhaK (pirin superfamily)